MDGLTDYFIRQIFAQLGGYDQCVTEFLRITTAVQSKFAFYRCSPELNPHHYLDNPNLCGKTLTGHPVYLQLLGSDPELLAENAFRASQLGCLGIDINFGCPAKTVNRHHGGANLLKYPETIYKIIQTIRQALPSSVDLTAKMRLGYEDKSLAIENAQAIESAGASRITVHARTKIEGYRPPAHWEYIARIKQNVNIDIIANGEIWNIEDYLKCITICECDHIMLGRGAFCCPDLALQIKSLQQKNQYTPMQWNQVQPLLENYFQLLVQQGVVPKKVTGRIKLWLKWLSPTYEEANEIFNLIKHDKQLDTIINILNIKKPNSLK